MPDASNLSREGAVRPFVADKPNIGKPCDECGMPVTPDFPGEVWGKNRHCHARTSVCIRALGHAITALQGERP